MEFLHVEGFRKQFAGTVVLKDINFDLPKGKILAIIGPSGGGKTTLLRCLNFLETPDEGKVYLDGELLSDAKVSYSQKERREKQLKFGLVFQSFHLFPHLTAIENILLAPNLLAKDRVKEQFKERKKAAKGAARKTLKKEEKQALKKLSAENKRHAEELLNQVGLSEKRDSYPSQLSGGQQQRVAIARALALSPEVLCFDEPTSALDPELTGEVLKVIRALKGRTLITVTHEMAFAREVADYVLFMTDGVIEERGTPEEVFLHPQKEKTKAFLKHMEEYHDE